MTGPEHYRAAELLQKHARDLAAADDSPDPADTANRIQRRMAQPGRRASTRSARPGRRARFRHNGDDTALTCGNMAWWPIVTAPLTAGP